MARSTLGRAIAGNLPTNTDDRNRVEFGFARSLGRDSFFNVDEIGRVARERREENPLVELADFLEKEPPPFAPGPGPEAALAKNSGR